MILLSILIPSIRNRVPMLLPLWDKLQSQATDEVEILALMDNKQRSIGMKRDALVQAAQGQFVAFVDDDDDVADTYCQDILVAIKQNPFVDVIAFPTICVVEDHEPVTIRHGLEFENTEWNAPNPTRKPWCCHPWRADWAKIARFPDINYGEDAEWVGKIIRVAKEQAKIDNPLYRYTYRRNISEAHA